MRRTIVAFAAVAVLAAMAMPAVASVQAGNNFALNYPTDAQLQAGGYPAPPHGSEGPFYMQANGGTVPATDNFLTFCVEQHEYFTPGVTYKVGGITGASVMTNRLLSTYDAWLYTQFRAQTMPSQWMALVNNSATRQEAYNMLQYAIWGGMVANNVSPTDVANVGQTGAEQVFGVTNSYLGTSFSATDLNNAGIGPASFTASGWSGWGVVQVLNLYDLNGGNAQDQLGLTQDLGVTRPIPEPISLIVWSVIGMCGCITACWRRKRVA